jgi:hypothetical protein
LAQQVRARLLGRIMDRDLPPGARLNIDALARDMGVSSSLPCFSSIGPSMSTPMSLTRGQPQRSSSSIMMS